VFRTESVCVCVCVCVCLEGKFSQNIHTIHSHTEDVQLHSDRQCVFSQKKKVCVCVHVFLET